jgi:predicted Rossmann fold nucleotide-binding protein DprA/Smf involved in DNA uptake
LGRPRLPYPWQAAIGRSQLLLLSTFDENDRRITKISAQKRNEFIAARADAVLIPHASAGGNAETIAEYVLRQGKPLFTLADEENAHLVKRGARCFDLESIKELLTPI